MNSVMEILINFVGVYPYEYIDSWNRFDERLLFEKEDFLQ